jgi:hypothetical protein
MLAKRNEEFEVVVDQDCLQVDSGRLQLIELEGSASAG